MNPGIKGSPKMGGANPGLTYRDAGVDLDAAAAAKVRIMELAGRTLGPSVLSEQGSFGGVIDPGANADTLLVSSTDSVGTKLRIAQAMGRHDTIGIDIVNHCINDILPAGATPLFFLDYIGLSNFDQALLSEILEGLSKACGDAGCALLGGETATLPGIYHGDDYDLVGFIVGTVQRDRLISPENTSEGDVLIGLPSSGLHTNGYSLVRKVFGTDDDASVLREMLPGDDTRTLGEALLEPHRSYLPLLRDDSGNVRKEVRGLAHITGGGIFKNIPRVIAKGLAAEVDVRSWETPPLFAHIQRTGGIDDREMYRVFNMGMGMVVVVADADAEALLTSIDGAWRVGRLVARTGDERVIAKGL
ncbi:MAG: phosphoribosylformylglycinamidine cyclo-ligase [Chloroflexi bacterium]|nr:phosphoribosylformylglycinamidine cyclo-ligase [Chloroflexota bacterium]MDA1297244.1 phosphoribosylformylglycinamidine cyclo-ligase [Chloroflexota bacterium]